MQRSDFLKILALLPLAGNIMSLNAFESTTKSLSSTGTMPLLFCGHGSPMNAIEDNEFSRSWQQLGKKLPKPNAVLCISAHWETKGTFVTTTENPKTIHDFVGFPAELFAVQYPAKGSPAIAQQTKDTITGTEVGLDQNWGLDHGCWSVVKHIYPNADIPVLQLSLDYTQPALYHYNLAKELVSLRKKGILIVGSGNIVHNLRRVAWDKMNEPEFGFDWALEANSIFKGLIDKGDHKTLADYKSLGSSVQLAIPTPEHFLPLLYILAMKAENETLNYFNDKAIMGSLTMTSLQIG